MAIQKNLFLERKELLEGPLNNSGRRIEEETGEFPLTISYPVGSYDKRTIKAAKKAGYKYGLAVHQRFYNPDNDDLFEIPRTELYNETWLKTKMRINGNLERIKKLCGR
ncbi:MAG: polysaccharide deacetylase family protein [Candidatus Delongbacteria bacterium]|nr:polysaccharide deacetylase family protein [Candidatus Delongbacteria bacterium]